MRAINIKCWEWETQKKVVFEEVPSLEVASSIETEVLKNTVDNRNYHPEGYNPFDKTLTVVFRYQRWQKNLFNPVYRSEMKYLIPPFKYTWNDHSVCADRYCSFCSFGLDWYPQYLESSSLGADPTVTTYAFKEIIDHYPYEEKND